MIRNGMARRKTLPRKIEKWAKASAIALIALFLAGGAYEYITDGEYVMALLHQDIPIPTILKH